MRRGDWEQAFAAYLAGCEGRPYAWGEHDCLLFAAGAAIAITGEDPAAHVRGRYRSKRGALRVLRELGHGSLEAAIDARYPETPIGFARRGDWALYETAVGVVVGRIALFVGGIEDGGDEQPRLIRVPRHEWQKAWSVE